MNILSVFGELLAQSGFAALTWQQAVMLLISFILLYLAIKKMRMELHWFHCFVQPQRLNFKIGYAVLRER